VIELKFVSHSLSNKLYSTIVDIVKRVETYLGEASKVIVTPMVTPFGELRVTRVHKYPTHSYIFIYNQLVSLNNLEHDGHL
jgi:hypothetical protein